MDVEVSLDLWAMKIEYAIVSVMSDVLGTFDEG